MGLRVAAVVACLVLAGCGAADPRPAAPTTTAQVLAAVPGIAGEVVRLRADEAVGGQVQVRLTDTGDEPFTVTSAVLLSPALAELPATVRTAEFAPGRTIDLPVPYGAVDCTADVQPVAARVGLLRAGVAEEVVVPLSGDALDLVVADECAAQRVAAAVTISVAGLTAAGDHLTGEVVVARVPGGRDDDVVLASLGQSVLLAPVATGLPATLPDDEDELRLPLAVGLASCDPHVLAETKKPFVFPLTVEVGGERAVVDLPLDEEQRGRLQGLVDEVCS